METKTLRKTKECVRSERPSLWTLKCLLFWLLAFIFIGASLRTLFGLFWDQIQPQIKSAEAIPKLAMFVFLVKVTLYQSLLIILLLSIIRRKDIKVIQVWGPMRVGVQSLCGSILFGVFFAIIWSWLARNTNSSTYYSSDFVISILMVSFALLAPIAEEIFFRGLFYHEIRYRIPTLLAVPASALIFTLYHTAYFNKPVNLMFAFLFGILTAVSYEQYKSLSPGFLFHMSVNATIQLINNKYIIL
jgi:membrane protease YdiL (CAAX protease family)